MGGRKTRERRHEWRGVLAHVSDVNTIFSCQEKLDHAILSKNIMQTWSSLKWTYRSYGQPGQLQDHGLSPLCKVARTILSGVWEQQMGNPMCCVSLLI